MARADLILDLIKYSFEGNKYQCKKVVEALVAEERSKQHLLLADKLQKELEKALHSTNDGMSKPELSFSDTSSIIHNFLQEVPVKKSFEEMVLPEDVKKVIGTFIEEQLRADLLRSYGLEPRHKIILAGKPGTGKTSFAEALAERLMVPLFVVRYDALIGSYLGETATRLRQLFDFVSTRKCILFFDEFDTIGKERGDSQELGEIKRVVSSLLLMTDSPPNYTIVIGASNHPELLDRAVWRRFQLRLQLPMPSKQAILTWLELFQEKYSFKFDCDLSFLASDLHGNNFGDIETFALTVLRRYILALPGGNTGDFVREELKNLKMNLVK